MSCELMANFQLSIFNFQLESAEGTTDISKKINRIFVVEILP